MNSIISLHDSDVGAIVESAGRVICTFSEAYIYKSEGMPGEDAGTAWAQKAILTFEEAELMGILPELPCVIWEGDFILDDADQHGVIPIPLVDCFAAEMKLKFTTVHSIRIRGTSPSLHLEGEPKFLQQVAAFKRPD